MNLDHANPQPQDQLHVGENVGGVAWMQAAAGKQPLGIFLNVVRNELIDTVGEANHFGRHVVDQHCTVNSTGVQIRQKCLGGVAEFDDLLKVWALLFHQ